MPDLPFPTEMQKTKVSVNQEVLSSDLNDVSTYLHQLIKDFNVNVFQYSQDGGTTTGCIISGLKITWDSANPDEVTLGQGVGMFSIKSEPGTYPPPVTNPAGYNGSLFENWDPFELTGLAANASNPRIAAIDFRYREADSPNQVTRNFIQPGTPPTIVAQSTPVTTEPTFYDDVSFPQREFTLKLGTPAGSPMPPTLTDGYIRIATFTIPSGPSVVIPTVGGDGTAPTTLVYSLPYIWNIQGWPGTPNTFDQDDFKTLADSLGAIRAQLSAIIGADTDKWYDVPPASLTSLLGNNTNVKVGADIRMFDIEHKPVNGPADWTNGLNMKGIVVSRGKIGFPDGSVRINPQEKYLDFSRAVGTTSGTPPTYVPVFTDYNSGGTPQRLGTVDSFPVSQPGGSSSFLKVNTRYAVFATADHPGTEFNVIASEIPFIEDGVAISNSGAQITATKASPAFLRGFFPNRTIVRIARAPISISANGQNLDLGNISTTSNPGRISGSGDKNEVGVYPTDPLVHDQPKLTSVSNSVITTFAAGETVALDGNDSNGSVLVIGGYTPGNRTGTVFNKYRYLGSFMTDASGLIRPFEIVGEDNIFLKPTGYIYSLYFNFNGSTNATTTFTLDFAGFVPGTAKSAELVADIGADNVAMNGAANLGYCSAFVMFARDIDALNQLLVVGPAHMGDTYKRLFTWDANHYYYTRGITTPCAMSQSTMKTGIVAQSIVSMADPKNYRGYFGVGIRSFKESIFDEWRRQVS